MAKIYKELINNDIKSTRTLLHEAIPLTGSLVSGTYGVWPDGGNIKNYAHGMFQSCYDYPYLSSSANQIFDLTMGFSTGSALSASTTVMRQKKINMYNQMAGTLMGYDSSGSIIPFDADGDLAGTTSDKINDAFFINFSRLIQKDEIKKGSFTIKLGGELIFGKPNIDILTITDSNAQNNYRVNAAAGDYGILTASAGGARQDTGNTLPVGLIFYQAGVVVLTASVFMGSVGGANPTGSLEVKGGVQFLQNKNSTGNGAMTSVTAVGAITGTSISGCVDAFRHRIYDISFNNTTELNSTIHFCRINNSDYNYSSNPTYLSASKLRVKNSQLDAPVSYFTTVGLYSADNELLAVAKLSEPLKKDPTNEMTVRVRLDY